MRQPQLKILKIFLLIFLMFGSFQVILAQSDDYIPVHTEEQLTALFSQVESYLSANGEEILRRLDDTQDRVITQALIRSWGIVQYEDADPRQIDDAYDALFNMSLFLGLAADPSESFSSGLIFEYAVL